MPTIPPLTTGYTLEEAEQDIADLRGQVDGMDEIITLLDGPIPNGAPISGCQVFSVNGQPNYLNFTALQMSLMGARPATFPGISNSTATPTTLASFALPAGDADVGAIYEVEVWGDGNQGSTQEVLNLGVNFGGNAMASIELGSLFMAINTVFRWRAVVRVICITTGLTGTWSSEIHGNLSLFNGTLLSSGASSANATNSFVSCESTGTTSVDTTTGETLAIQGWWGASTGTPTITSRVAFVKRLC
jgi:hypothetical protein